MRAEKKRIRKIYDESNGSQYVVNKIRKEKHLSLGRAEIRPSIVSKGAFD